MPYETTVEWKGQRVFEATPPSGIPFTMDTHPDLGGQGQGPTPLEAFISAAAACSAMDVISILEKKRQKVTSYRILIEGDRTVEGVFPRPFATLRLRHLLEGENLDAEAAARAVELSEEKYCTILATLRHNPTVTSTVEIAETVA